MTNKLYLITQDYNNGWDTYDSAVVCAISVHRARRMHPGGPRKSVLLKGEDEFEDTYGTWCPLEYVNVTYLGDADLDIKIGVICASYKAG